MSDESDLAPLSARPLPDRPSDFSRLWAHDVATVIHESAQLAAFLGTEMPRLTAELNAATSRFNEALAGLEAGNARLESIQRNWASSGVPEIRRQLAVEIGESIADARKKLTELNEDFTDTLAIRINRAMPRVAGEANDRAIHMLLDTAEGKPGAALADVIQKAVAAGIAEHEVRKEQERQQREQQRKAQNSQGTGGGSAGGTGASTKAATQPAKKTVVTPQPGPLAKIGSALFRWVPR
jgi:hypothetical protein